MLRIIYLALLMAVFAEPALAGEPPFDPRTAVSDQTLSAIRGTQGWQLTPSNLARLTDGDSAANLQGIGKTVRTQMDVWWGTTGASLIAASVRTQG